MKAFLIARVSTDEQSDALPGQIYRLKDYAERKGYDFDLFEIKESAYKGTRSTFKEIIDRVISQPDECIIVFDKIDRYTRNSNSNEVSLLNNLCRAGKIEMHFPSDSLFINKSSSAQEQFMLNMGVSTSQFYSDSISDNVKRRNQQKWRDGEWCGKAPIGYKNIGLPTGKKWVTVDKVYSKAIQTAFELYASGNSSLREIAKIWREEFGLTKTGSSKIDQVLKNPFYYGEMRVKEKIYPHKYEPIITRALFEKAKLVREGFKVTPHRWGGLPFAYRGLIRCAECGCRITFESKKGKYIYGHCTRKKNKHPVTYVNEDKITQQVVNILKQVQIPEDAFNMVSEAIRRSHVERKANYQSNLRVIEAEIKKYQTRKDKTFEAWLDGGISEEIYKQKTQEFDSQIKLKQEQIQSLELFNEEQYINNSYLLSLAKSMPNLFLKADQMQKRTFINLVVSNLELDGDLLRWKLKEPFKMMALCNETLNWLRLLGSNQRPIR